MATNKSKKGSDYQVREPNIDDAFDLVRILAGAGGGQQIGAAVGIVIGAFQTGDTAMLTRAASTAITDGLHAGLRDVEVTQDLRRFLYGLWDPKLGVARDEDEYEQKKSEAWSKLPMRGLPELINAFRQTEGFGDFIAFFTELMPTQNSEENSSSSSTASNESTASSATK